MAKGDKISVLSQIGPTGAQQSHIEARQNGRTVHGEFEKEQGLIWYVVTEATRGGTMVRRDRYLVTSIISVREDYGE